MEIQHIKSYGIQKHFQDGSLQQKKKKTQINKPTLWLAA